MYGEIVAVQPGLESVSNKQRALWKPQTCVAVRFQLTSSAMLSKPHQPGNTDPNCHMTGVENCLQWQGGEICVIQESLQVVSVI